MFGKPLVVLLFCGVALAARTKTVESAPSPRKQLEAIVEADEYDPLEAPGEAAGHSTEVSVGFYVNSLLIDEDNTLASLSCYFRQKWNDPRLTFTPVGSVTRARLFDSDDIWTPDTFFRGVVESVDSDHELVFVSSTGDVWFVKRIFATFPLQRTSSAAAAGGTNYVIPIHVESFGYTNTTLTLTTLSDPPIQVNEDLYLGRGRVYTGTSSADCTTSYTSGTYPCWEFSINLTIQEQVDDDAKLRS